jgi:hypothetical protein
MNQTLSRRNTADADAVSRAVRYPRFDRGWDDGRLIDPARDHASHHWFAMRIWEDDGGGILPPLLPARNEQAAA